VFVQSLPHVRRWLNILLTRPLTLREAAIAGAVLLALGTVYCQIYCLLALQKMLGASMPLWASAHRASVDVVPAFAVFELGKRITVRGPLRWTLLTALFVAAVAAAVAWRMQLHIMEMGLTPRRIAVDRIPFMALAGAGLAHFYFRSKSAAGERVTDEPETLPPARMIDWIKAAGTYVEVHFNGRSKLMRMTLRQAMRLLPSGQFLQIHRSIVVNASRIAHIDPRLRRVELTDGATFRVGETYRVNLPRP
jgi:hypothetical protein